MATTDLSIHSAEYSLRNPAAGSPGRLLCLDIYRGLMVAGMIIVDNPGSDEHAYWPIMHAKWNGWTPADFQKTESSYFNVAFVGAFFLVLPLAS